ncbi:hypothetical protein ACLB2K_024472 [Fragaria x ananassa]
MLTKLFFYLNFLFWQHLGTQLKFQARADTVPPAANGATLPQNEGLTAVIPEEVGALRYLTNLDLSNNKLQGPIPAALGDLYDLKYLDLSSNQLTGSIPDLGSLRNLRALSLERNLLEGTIPPTLGSLGKLESLDLHFNKLSGSIPDDLGKLVNLIALDISENQLTGPLPEIGELKNLTGFLAAANSLTGAFPESYGELTSLEAFVISGNYISGPLPVDIIKRWTNIVALLLLGNNFKGKVTKEVFNLPNLEHLHISDLEDATFELPSNITNTKYVSLILRNCSINGSIPKYIGDQMTSLNYLDLSFNDLTGELPEYMKSDILYMSFSTNMLNGTIPAWIFRTVKTRIDLSFNKFTALESGVPRNKELNLFACCHNSATTQMRDPLEMMMNTNCLGKEQKYHSLFINCGGGETTINGETYEQDNDTSSFFTSPNKNWAYSSSGSGGFLEGNTSYIKNMTCGVSIAEAPLYDRARLSPVSLKYYAFCLREGKYNVTLKFTEIFYTDDTDYTSLRKRAFDIYIQDDKIKRDFNIEEQAGGPDKPITRSFTAVVNKTNPLLKIHLYWDGKGSIGLYEPALNGPLISAIAVTPEFKVHDQKLHPLHITLIGIGSTFAVLLLLAFAWMVWLRSRSSPKIKVGEEKKGEEIQDKHVTLKELIDATGKFSDKNKIGTGSLEKVYKAELLGQVKTTVAVKKLSSHFKENIQKLKKEIKWLYELEHENLIKLFDYHIEKDLQILVYEYMENGSLEDALTTGDSNTRSLKFTWDTRFKMCLGIARGLEYLHEHRKLNIAHMNIKAVNILLDGDLNPKISDFGLAHLYVEEDQFKVIKSDVLQGYTAPEYFHGKFSNKGDVYSFGVILLEIVCWKKNVIKSHHGTEVLVDKANENHERGRLEDMIDKTLQGVDTKQALTILQLAVKCTNIAPSVRPTMSQVVSVLLDKMKIDELFRPAPPNVGEKIMGTRDLASVDATSMELTLMPSTSSPSPKTKDELESIYVDTP